jgi:hypothetical protein
MTRTPTRCVAAVIAAATPSGHARPLWPPSSSAGTVEAVAAMPALRLSDAGAKIAA